MKTIDSSAAIITIGDELLSGKIKDQNSGFLLRQLSKRGVKVRYCVMIPDEVDVIKKIVLEYSAIVRWVFISGGLGPTPDDLTMESIAAAFGLPLIEEPLLAKIIKKLYGKTCTPEHMRMAKVPEGTELIVTSEPNIPVIQFRNMFIFPGVPEFLKSMFFLIESQFRGAIGFLKELNVRVDEGIITKDLQEFVSQYPGVQLGSYPTYDVEGSRVKLILEHEDENYLNKAYDDVKRRVSDYLL
jgi:molybdenum cofactor synthesis domain-containing protein